MTATESLKIYSFFRSGTSHRLRIALNLKGLDAEYIGIDLRREEHLTPEFRTVNPQQLVPALVVGKKTLTQSVAIIEWLEEAWPEPALLPKDPFDRAYVRALAALIGCDIHPVNNRRILERLRSQFGADAAAVDLWCQTWIAAGFEAYESMLASDTNRDGFSFGSSPTLADVYLIPQINSARRFELDLSPYPLILQVEANCKKLEPFQRAEPEVQPDAS